jgi:hypothetical protein
VSSTTFCGNISLTYKSGFPILTSNESKFLLNQAAVNAASDGATITCNAGSWTWGDSLTIPATKALTITGAGIDQTNITAGSIVITVGANKLVNISGFTFVSGGGIQYNGYTNCDTSDCTEVLSVHGNKFSVGNSITVYGRVYGVIWGNQFIGATPWTFVYAFPNAHDTFGTDDGGAALYEADTNLGGSNFVFFEGNAINITTPSAGSGVVDGRSGFRYVLRYNTVLNQMFNHHDAEKDYERGTRAFEQYNNSFVFDKYIPTGSYLRGGTGGVL